MNRSCQGRLHSWYVGSRRAMNVVVGIVALATCAVGLSGCAAMGPWSPLLPLERRIVFQPAGYPVGNWQPEGLPLEDAWFQAKDGTHLHGWYLKHDQPRAVALFCHGNGGNITGLAHSLAVLKYRHGLSVMTFDYRGYGRSEGVPSEEGILQDARAARAWLAQREEIAESDVVMMGQSLGGGVAVDLAARDGARGLVLASTFTSLPDVAGYHFPWLPARMLMTMRLNSLEKIKQYHGPLLISHGDADEVIPFRQGEALFAAAGNPKQFVAIPGGKHNDQQPDEYRTTFDHFISNLPPPGISTVRPADVEVFVQQ